MNTLKVKRKELGLTQLQAANACKVSLRTYQTYEETNNSNETSEYLYKTLTEMGLMDGSNYIASTKHIKNVTRRLLRDYPNIKCGYIYGSYADGTATGKDDVSILLVGNPLESDISTIISCLEKEFYKKVIIKTVGQITNDHTLIESILLNGIKI